MTHQAQSPDLVAIKSRQQQVWAAGDYQRIAASILIVSEQLCEAANLRAGQRVLDVATGTGNTALAAARRFCEVTGADYVPSLLERGRQRAVAEGLPVTFQEGDAEALPFPDAAFDVVLSTYGVMFSPNQEQAARELLRVCRPGGTIGLANHTPDSWIGEVFRTTGRHIPPPARVKPPVLWGTEERLRELFGDGITSLTATRRNFIWRFRSPEHYLDFFRTYYGPTLKGFEALGPDGQAALADDLKAAVLRFNRSDDDTLVVPSAYLEAVAIRR